MRTMSASSAKHPKWKSYQHREPSPNTKLRKIYDKFMANKGIPVEFELDTSSRNYMTNQLPDFYGLDIRRIDRNCYVLAGEWFGTTYVDYIAERLNG